MNYIFDRTTWRVIMVLFMLMIPIRFLNVERWVMTGVATYYDQQADAFMAGHTHFLRPPPPGLLALHDPWDPVENEHFRIYDDLRTPYFDGVHDLSLYKGQLYMQWGPVPALILLPIKLFTKKMVPPQWTAMIAVLLMQFFLMMSVLLMVTPEGEQPAQFIVEITTLTLFFVPSLSVILRRVAAYETAIIFAQLFCALTVFTLSLAFRRACSGKRQPWLLVLASTFLGLAVGSRENIVTLGVLLPVIWVLWCRLRPVLKTKQMVTHGLALCVPFLLCIAALLYYNYVRFDHFFEFGHTWQLGIDRDVRMQIDPGVPFHFLDIKRILPNIFYNFWSPPALCSQFPYLRQSMPFPLSWMSADQIGHYGHKPEPSSGLLAMAPVGLVVFFIPWLWIKTKTVPGENSRCAIGFAMLSGLAALILAFPYLMMAATMRYMADWMMLWLTSAMAALALLLQWSHSWSARSQKILRVSIEMATLWMCVVSVNYMGDYLYGFVFDPNQYGCAISIHF